MSRVGGAATLSLDGKPFLMGETLDFEFTPLENTPVSGLSGPAGHVSKPRHDTVSVEIVLQPGQKLADIHSFENGTVVFETALGTKTLNNATFMEVLAWNAAEGKASAKFFGVGDES